MNQIDKNTVKGSNQLKESDYVVFDNIENKGKRVMFVGNSITLHGVKEDIGWYTRHGMAASSIENDYVHICQREIQKFRPDAAFCICQVCEWETNYKNAKDTYYLYDNAVKFDADLIIMRAIENCKTKDFDKEIFKKEYADLIDHLNPSGKAKVVVTTGFYKHPGDEAVLEYAEERGIPACVLGDLGEDDEMKAIGKFEHSGVANHPGDLGMKVIAERIMNLICEGDIL